MTGQRRLIPGAASPHPLIATLPGLYQDDLLMQRSRLRTGRYAGPDYFTLD